MLFILGGYNDQGYINSNLVQIEIKTKDSHANDKHGTSNGRGSSFKEVNFTKLAYLNSA